MRDLIYAIPAYRNQVHPGHMFAMLELGQALGPRVTMTWADTCSLDWARNVLVHSALNKMPCRWLLMADADTWHPRARDTLLMLHEGDTRKAAVIAAPVQARVASTTYNVATAEGGERNLQPDEFLGRVIRAERVGTAYMAVNVEWLRATWPVGPWFQSRQIDRGAEPPGWLGEDFAFCDGVRARGGTILVDGRFEPTHSGVTSEAAVTRKD